MATEYRCDLCNAPIPVPKGLIPVTIGDELIAEACFKCTTQVKKNIRDQKLAAANAFKAGPAPAPAPAPIPPSAEAPKPTQPAAPTPPAGPPETTEKK